MTPGSLSLLLLVLGSVLAVAKAGRDILIVRRLTAMLADCSPEERVRVCLQLAQSLHWSSWQVPGLSWVRGSGPEHMPAGPGDHQGTDRGQTGP